VLTWDTCHSEVCSCFEGPTMSEPNAEQAAYWNDAAGRTWAEVQEALDRQLGPLGRATIAALAVMPGERILDVGCGSGQTSLELARLVQPNGAVLGVDLSAPLLEVARRRASGVGSLSFAQGDAQIFPFAPESFDAAFSRFGVMFFADPVAAFINIRRALKPGGRLAFACWRTADENPTFTLPMQAAAPYLPPIPPAAEPEAPGPFAFARQERVRGILAAAGFEAVKIAPHDEAVGSGNLETAVALSLRIGMLGRFLNDNPSLREVAAQPVQAALAAHDGPEGIKLDAAIWIVTARSSG
jgi:SAM-dependent methyltransferase